jgi:para-aminobenzoate synthetase component 1
VTEAFAPLVARLATYPDAAATAERFLDLPWLLLLDSTADPERTGRYSFLSADPFAVIRGTDGTSARLDLTTGAWHEAPEEPLAAVRAALAPFRTEPVAGLPPFQGGAGGFIGYDYGGVLERLPSPRYGDLPIPDVCLGLYDWVIAWDHHERAAWIVSTGMPWHGANRHQRAAERLAWVQARLAADDAAGAHAVAVGSGIAAPDTAPFEVAATAPAPSYPVVGIDGAEQIGLRSTFTHRGYLTAVARVREYILAGDIFQANLSQRFEAPLAEPPFALYQRLRRMNPASFGAYLDFNGMQVLSVSPERFLRLEGRTVETRPIKGTRPRGLGPMHDAMLGRVLSESDKDRAENVMIVDLLRNDLSRVCLPRTVRVPELFTLEQHPTVHHLVSTVVGELDPGADAIDLLHATFPGGSITGAPKVRAMEIIAELEPTRRKVYCGSLGYLSVSGAMDTSIAIRSAVSVGGQVYFQAGGGIVADSDPESEYRETLDKARGIIRTLAAR